VKKKEEVLSFVANQCFFVLEQTHEQRKMYVMETGILLPNNQRQHRTSHAPKDVLPLRTCDVCQTNLQCGYTLLSSEYGT